MTEAKKLLIVERGEFIDCTEVIAAEDCMYTALQKLAEMRETPTPERVDLYVLVDADPRPVKPAVCALTDADWRTILELIGHGADVDSFGSEDDARYSELLTKLRENLRGAGIEGL